MPRMIAVILGTTGANFGAGMTGGMAFVYDEDGRFPTRANPESIVWQQLGSVHWEAVLKALEEGREGHKPLARIDDLPLFGAAAPLPKTSAVEEALKAVEPDALTPKQALEILYDLKRKLN